MEIDNTKYIVVTFPESQELMCKRDFGSSAFFVEEKWYKKVNKL